MILGIVLFLNTELVIEHLIWLIIISILVYGIIFIKYQGSGRLFLGYLGIFILAIFGYYNASRSFKINDKDNISNESEYKYYESKIVSLVEEKPKSWKAIAEVSAIIKGGIEQNCSGKILLYFDKNDVAKPKFGDKLLIKGIPALIEGPKNPNQFNYKKYLGYQGLYHQHYLRDTSFVKIPKTEGLGIKGLAFQINNYCDSVFTKYIPKKQELAVTNAMVLGLRDDIDNDLMAAYSAAGAIHVLSVSGLHVGVIYIILVWIFGSLKKNLRWGKWLFLGIILSILWMYAAVTGFSSPVMRSTFMFSLILISETINRQQNSYNTLAISAFCLLVFDPLLITNVGFMLSYLAVFGMIQIQPLLNPLIIIDKDKTIFHWLSDRIWKVTTVAVAAQIATLPITIYYFHQFPNYFLLANPLVILLSSIVLIGGLAFLLLVVLFSFLQLYIVNEWLGIILQFFVKALNETVLFTENLPGAISKNLNFNYLEVILLYFLIFSLLTIIQTKKYAWVKTAIFVTAILIGISITNNIKINNQNIVAIHSIPKSTAISVINGSKLQLHGNAALLSDRKIQGYYLNNFWSEKGIVETNKITLSNETNLKVWKGKSYLFLNNRLKANESILNVDFLIIKHKKLRYFSDIKGKIKFKFLIIDGSLSNFYSNRIQVEAAQDGVLAYSLIKEGALIL